MNIQDVKEMYRKHIRQHGTSDGSDYIQDLAESLGYELWFDFTRRDPSDPSKPLLIPTKNVYEQGHADVVACPLQRGRNV